MNLITIFQKFPDQQACIDRLEMVRWADGSRFLPILPK